MTIKKIGNDNSPPLQIGALDQEQTTQSGYGTLLSPPYISAQSFKPTKEILTDVQLWFFKVTNPPAGVEITVSIRDALNGADLTAKTINADDVGIPGSGKWVPFNFEDITVIPEETYYIVCHASDGGTQGNCYCWYFGVNDLYTRGEAWLSDTNGATWVTLEEMHPQFPEPDFCFKTYGLNNNPPNPPSNPDPPDDATGININAILSWTCNDPDGDDLVYDVYFEAGDPTPDVLVSDDQTQTTYNPGTLEMGVTYYWKIIAKDEHDVTTSGPIWKFTTGSDNQPPTTPEVEGETSGNAGTEYEYTFNAVDPDGDNVKYHIDWDDGDSESTDFFSSGTDVKVKHTWDNQDTYIIRVTAEDTNGLVGPEGTLSVSMPRNRAIMNTPFLNFLEQYPILYHLLQRFLRL